MGFMRRREGEEKGGKEKRGGEYFIIYSINDTVINAEIGIVIDVLQDIRSVDCIGTRGS
jgi:hypothetical protein